MALPPRPHALKRKHSDPFRPALFSDRRQSPLPAAVALKAMPYGLRPIVRPACPLSAGGAFCPPEKLLRCACQIFPSLSPADAVMEGQITAHPLGHSADAAGNSLPCKRLRAGCTDLRSILPRILSPAAVRFRQATRLFTGAAAVPRNAPECEIRSPRPLAAAAPRTCPPARDDPTASSRRGSIPGAHPAAAAAAPPDPHFPPGAACR